MRVIRNGGQPANVAGVTFFNADNRHSQDRLDLLESEGLRRYGRQANGSFAVEGVTTFDQARRALATFLAEQARGNGRTSADGRAIGDASATIACEFETSVKGMHLRAGDIVAVSFQRLGWARQLFRVTSIAPSASYGRIKLRCQWQ